VVTTGMLRQLGPAHRRALLAHERSHLRHRHYLYESIATLAAAINPLLWRLPAAIRLSCERWADEDAAALSCRNVTADAVLQAAVGRPASLAHGLFAAAVTDVEVRVAALRAPVQRVRPWCVTALVVVLVTVVGAALAAAYQTDQLFDLAKAAYRAGRR
jgi:beta-lactamase regulating signal transducer with metallopeptidase domain